MTSYAEFIEAKSQLGSQSGFAPLWMPDSLFDFQSALVEWALIKGKAAILAGTGLGKTLMQLVWAENVVRKTNRPVLILTPLCVSFQTVREAAKFGIQATRVNDGKVVPGINVTNYERLDKFNAADFAGLVCDESGILKNFNGVRKAQITEFMRLMQYRLLCTATPAPNDYIELGTSAEALGELGYMDMLGMFFKNDQNSLHPTSGRGRFERGIDMSQNKWRFKKHAERQFWRWVCSWARAVRMPSDVDPSFDDSRYVLPPLVERETVVKRTRPLDGMLFTLPANGLKEQRDESRKTINERCECVAQKITARDDAAVAWCHLNDEGDLLKQMIPESEQVSGKDSDERKEEIFEAFTSGQLKRLIVKPKIAAHGMNWQHCHFTTFFPSHSFEQYWQGIRRMHRFGQKHSVEVEIVSTEGESGVLRNLQRKALAAGLMFDALIAEMRAGISIGRSQIQFEKKMEQPKWLQPKKLSIKSMAKHTRSTMAIPAR